MANTAHGKAPRARRGVTATTTVTGAAITPHVPAASLGTIIAISPDGIPQVRVAGGSPVVAMVLAHVSSEHLTTALANGSQVLLTFIDGNLHRPVIIGVVAASAVATRSPTTAKVDGQRVELTGQDEVVLTCGKASITLTKAGKVIIKGTYVSSAASSGTNRITGGSVQIN